MSRQFVASRPRIYDKPAERMAVVETVGDPNAQQAAMSALYSTVYALKFQQKKAGHDFKVTGLRARWPDAHLVPREQWHARWGLPVPAGTTALPVGDGAFKVALEDWSYGPVAELLHIGPYSAEGPDIEALHRFIEESGYELAGSHEEEYLTTPRANVQKTLIRYPIHKRLR